MIPFQEGVTSMPFSGRQTIESPLYTLFYFVAAQRGAGNEQIAQVTERAARDIYHANRDTSSILAFPLAGPRTGIHLDDVWEWWLRWKVENADLEPLTAIGLHSARELVDPWLKHDHGRWQK